MRGVTFSAWRGEGRISLADIVQALDHFLEGLDWRMKALECAGVGAEAMHRLADADGTVPTQQLLDLARAGVQVIDGEFVGYRGNEARITIRAVDGSSWDVESNDASVLHTIKRFAPDAIPIPN